METIKQNAGNKIIKIKENLYVISEITKEDVVAFSKTMIEQKNNLASNNIELGLDDLALVRIMKKEMFPIGLKYTTSHFKNITSSFDNPFGRVLDYICHDISEFKNADIKFEHSKIKSKELKLEYPVYRRTKHFSINGLASNVRIFLGFNQILDNGEIIIIEPLSDHWNDNLINLNPVDTFFDLENSSMKIGGNAIVVIESNLYFELINNPRIKEDLDKTNVILYEPEKIIIPENSKIGLTTFVTDLALAYFDYMPQHSFQQSELRSEYFFMDNKTLDDEKYLKLFQDCIEKLSIQRLGISYYKVPRWAVERRMEYNDEIVGLPGVLHADTKIAQEDSDMNFEYMTRTLKSYLEYLFKTLGLDETLALKIYSTYSKDLAACYNSCFENSFYNTYNVFNEMIDFLEKTGYTEFFLATADFNNIIKGLEVPKNHIER